MESDNVFLSENVLFELLDHSFEKASAPLIWQSEDGGILRVNDAAAAYFGYTREEMVGMNAAGLSPDLDADALRTEWSEILRSGSISLCARHICAGGEIKHAEIVKTLVTAGNSEISLVTVENVSPLKQKTDEIQFLYEIMDMSNDAIFVIRPSDGRVMYANEKACVSLGYSPEELKGIPLDYFRMSSKDWGEFAPYLSRLSEANGNMLYCAHKRKDGSVFPVETSLKSFIRDNEKYNIAVVRDISERLRFFKEMEEKNTTLEKLNDRLTAEVVERTMELHFTEEKYETYVKNAPDPIFFTDEKGRHKDVNEALCLITGYTREELLSTGIFGLVAEDSLRDAESAFKEMRKTGKASVSLKLAKKNGEKFYIYLNIAEVEGGVYMGICKDVTRSVLLEEALKKLNEELSERVREEVALRQKQEGFLFEQKKLEDMGLLINAIAHQWRQPINALILYIQDIMDTYESGELSGEYIHTFETVCKDLVIHMSKTIDDFRTFFAPDKTRTCFDVAAEMVRLMKLLRVQLHDRKISYRIYCICADKTHDCTEDAVMDDCPGGRALVCGYLDEFKQALMNIVYNAVDAIEENFAKGIVQKGFIRIEIENTPGHVVLRIKDNGTGISPEKLSKVFDPYYTTKEEGKGTGIGLYMAKMVIEKHNGGRISAGNADGGAFFEILIPKSSG
ncbi:PAS domain S-box protein [Geovibrio thiophilus]|uniref:histidine kinase n=1 Tax=Geovibrio thiophilus TaxID=139438 RepID=A0A410JVX4_9BACT|nr:PAS domain S-box protein [Geovibrio thiophilus]QAR32324.1 PAS domain S-box protein [Geovibrio thiophilus]